MANQCEQSHSVMDSYWNYWISLTKSAE